MSTATPTAPSRTIVEVPFSGHRSGTAPATWGQTYWRQQFEAVGADDYGFNVVVQGTTDEGIEVDHAIGFMIDLMRRHDALRTTHRLDAEGRFEQVLHGEGVMPVIIESAHDEADSADRLERLTDELYHRRFDIVHELPMRVALVLLDGRVRHMVVIVSHLSIDGTGIRLLANEIIAVAGAGDIPERIAAVQGRADDLQQPLDEAAEQHDERGRRHDERVRARILDELRQAPAPMFPKPADDAQPRYRYRKAVLRSARVLAAAEHLSQHYRVTPSTIILAAAAMAFAQATDRDDCGMRLLVNNRFRPERALAISPLAQDTPYQLDGVGAGAEFAEVLPRAWRRMMAAFKNAYYDPVAFAADLAETGLEYDDSCRYNDHLPLGPGAWEYRYDIPVGELGWFDYPVREADDRAICLDVHDAAVAIDLSLLTDLNRVPAELAEGILRTLERILVDEHERLAGGDAVAAAAERPEHREH